MGAASAMAREKREVLSSSQLGMAEGRAPGAGTDDESAGGTLPDGGALADGRTLAEGATLGDGRTLPRAG